MKKFVALFVFFLSLLSVNAKEISWNEELNMFLEGFKEESKDIEQEFTSLGIDAKVSCGYIEAKKQIYIDVRFKEAIWNLFNEPLMKEAKEDMLKEYKESYRTDKDFATFINDMKSYNYTFLISYSTLKNGKVESKDFTITPQEIIN